MCRYNYYHSLLLPDAVQWNLHSRYLAVDIGLLDTITTLDLDIRGDRYRYLGVE